MTVTVIDNFLEDEEFKKIQDLVSSDYFPWFYNNTVLNDSNNESVYDGQFIHNVITNGHIVDEHVFHLFGPVFNKLEVSSIIRLKLNLNTATHIPYLNGLHVDVPEDNKGIETAILYLNTNNGSTVFEDGTEVMSVANRLAVFDVNTKHQAKTSTDTKVRYVANINFKKVVDTGK